MRRGSLEFHIVCEHAPASRALAAYGVTGAPGAGLGMRKVYTTPNTMVVPFGWPTPYIPFRI